MVNKRGNVSSAGISQAALDILRYLKGRYDYRGLSKLLHLSPSTLARYISGKTIPRYNNAKKIIERSIEIIKPSEIVKEYLGKGFDFEDTVYITQDIQVVKLLASHALSEFMGSRLHAVLALDLPSIPVATYFASITDCDLYFANEKPLWRDGRYVEISYRTESVSGRERMWLPVEVVERKQNVLVFVNRVLSANPLKEVIRLIERHKVHLTGIYTLISARKVWENLSTPPGCRKVSIIVYE